MERLIELPELEDVHFVGNPLEERMTREGIFYSCTKQSVCEASIKALCA